MTVSKKRKKRMVFSKLFGLIKKGDFVEFPDGSIIWKVVYVSKNEKTLKIWSMNSPYIERWYTGDLFPFYKIPNVNAINWMCRNHPSMLDNFKDKELIKFFRKNLKGV